MFCDDKKVDSFDLRVTVCAMLCAKKKILVRVV